MKRRVLWSMIAGMSFVSGAASAAQFGCYQSSIGKLAVSNNGSLYVETAFGTIGICDVDSTAGGVTAEVCRSWYSSLLTARATNTTASFYFDTANPDNAGLTPDVCTVANFGNWNTHPPYFVEFEP